MCPAAKGDGCSSADTLVLSIKRGSHRKAQKHRVADLGLGSGGIKGREERKKQEVTVDLSANFSLDPKCASSSFVNAHQKMEVPDLPLI